MKVKICGLKTLEEALAAIHAGADYLGFNFYARSPRYINPKDCKRIVRGIRERDLSATFVGVFVNQSEERINFILDECGLHLAQLSGNEPPGVLKKLGARAFKALRPRSSNDLLKSERIYPSRQDAPAWLIDGYRPGEFGGTGKHADWGLAREIAQRSAIFLAGGLTPDNVVQAIEQVRPWGVDVASGVEIAPGKKDPDKIKAFVKAVRDIRDEEIMTMANVSSTRIGDSSKGDASFFPRLKRSRMRSKFGPFGGQFVPETLMPALMALEVAYQEVQEDGSFNSELQRLQETYVGRPTPLSHARRLSDYLGGAQIYLKREDLAHSGAHKINNALGQALLAERMGKRRLVAETGAGQHGVATATAAALLGLECVVYMGIVDIERQQPNVHRMALLGAEVREVKSGSQTLKDAINEAIRDWVTNVDSTHYLLGSALGPHPYPTMVRDFQAVIGREARQQILDQAGKLPDFCIACVGGGSNAIGLFYAFLDDPEVALIGVEAGGEGVSSGRHAARFSDPNLGRPGVLHGTYSYLLQDEDGQVAATHSISAGLDYPAVGPEHAYLREIGRAKYTWASDKEALEAFQLLSRLEGILPALESSHAVAEAIKMAPKMDQDRRVVINLSGRGDKDLETVLKALEIT